MFNRALCLIASYLINQFIIFFSGKQDITNDLKRTNIFFRYFFQNIVPDLIGYKPKAPGYLSQEKQDMPRLETIN